MLVLLASLFYVYLVGAALDLWPLSPLLRPPGVPRSAHYVSLGLEEQTWFHCTADLARTVDHCRAWDGGGELIADGDYQLYFERRAATASELRPSLVKGAAGRYSGLVIYQFEYDRHNTFSRPLVLVSAINCIKFGERLSSFKAVGCY